MATFKAGTKANWEKTRKAVMKALTYAYKQMHWLGTWSTDQELFGNMEADVRRVIGDLKHGGVRFVRDEMEDNPRRKRRRKRK